MTSRRPQTLLIVDKDILVRQPIAAYLRECGYRVIEVPNFDEARRVVDHLLIDVILADVIAPAPEPDRAFAFASWIRTNHPDVQIMLAATLEKVTSNAGEVCELGPAVKKPPDHRLVLDRIKRFLASRERTRG